MIGKTGKIGKGLESMTGIDLRGVVVSIFAATLVLGGCGSDSNNGNQENPDTGPDAGGMDAEPDAGFADAGFDEPPEEAEACAGPTASQLCADGLTCVSFSGGTVETCLNICQSSADCTGSTLDPAASICAYLGRLVDNDGNEFGWCVQEVVGEGTVVLDPPNANITVTGSRLTSCDNDSLPLRTSTSETVCVRTCEDDGDCANSALSPAAAVCSAGICVQSTVGEGGVASISGTEIQGCDPSLDSFLSPINIGEVQCARICTDDDECTNTDFGVCNLGFGTDTATVTGICSRTAGTTGSPCSNRHIVDSCTFDIENNGLVTCSDFWGLNDNAAFNGVCVQRCGDLDDSPLTLDEVCVLPADRAGDPAPTCLTTIDDGSPLFPAAPSQGICADPCTNVPNSCGGTAPTQCFENQQLGSFNVTFAQCITPVEPLLPVWYPARGTPTFVDDCTGRYNQCPPDTFCLSVGGGSAFSVCIYGCDPNAPVGSTGCENRSIGSETNLVCNTISTTEVSLCEPAP